MAKLTILRGQDVATYAPHGLRTRLFVSDLKREDDARAIELFDRLAEVLACAGFTDREQVLSLVVVREADEAVLDKLPRLVNGSVYAGVTAIEEYVRSCEEGYAEYERLHA